MSPRSGANDGSARIHAPTFASVRRRQMINASQFNNADSYHQHCECYRIVIEPMPPLQYIHDTLPLFLGSHLSKSCCLPISAFRAVRRAQPYAGGWGRKSVVLGLEALPNCRQPNAAVPSKNCLALRETVTPRSAGGRHTCRRSRRLRLSWPQFARDEVGGVMPKPVLHHLPTDPVVDPVGC
jgi:hypothetical protein